MSTHTAPRVFLQARFALGVALVAGCASIQVTQATVALPSRLSGHCIATSLQSETEIAGYREMSEAGAPTYLFEVTNPALVADTPPTFLVRQKSGRDGRPLIEVVADFEVGRGASELREAMLQRQQAVLSRVLQQCTGRSPQFGGATECGKGEGNTLCVHGELQ